MQEKKILSIILLATAALSLIIVSSIGFDSVFAQAEKFRAKLQGKTEIPPVTSAGGGKAQFKVKDDGITSKINVTGITEVTGAHIYSGKKGENGQPIVDLLKSSTQEKTTDGLIIQGKITASDFEGNMTGKTLTDLQSAMATEHTYLNILTGDHPDGELRGQIKVVGNSTDTTSSDTSFDTSSDTTDVETGDE